MCWSNCIDLRYVRGNRANRMHRYEHLNLGYGPRDLFVTIDTSTKNVNTADYDRIHGVGQGYAVLDVRKMTTNVFQGADHRLK